MPALTLETPRLLLRPWRKDDIEPWLRMNADPRVREFFARNYDRESNERWARELTEQLERDGYGWWVLEIREGLKFGGNIVLRPVPFDAPFNLSSTPVLEIAWRLAPEEWNKDMRPKAPLLRSSSPSIISTPRKLSRSRRQSRVGRVALWNSLG